MKYGIFYENKQNESIKEKKITKIKYKEKQVVTLFVLCIKIYGVIMNVIEKTKFFFFA